MIGIIPQAGKLLGQKWVFFADQRHQRAPYSETKTCTGLKNHGVLTTKMTSKIPRANVRHNSVSFDIEPYKLHLLEKGPASTGTIDAMEALKLYTEMVRGRRLEAVSSDLYKEKKIRGFCHLYSGQEAIAVGMHSMMRPVDSVITSYRCHVWAYLMGNTVLQVLAELTGRKSGCSRGKGGSMHMFGKNFYGGNGIVGAHVSLGTGIAFAHKYRGDGGICFTLYGDGACNQGQVHESYNMAKLWSLPVMYICENNHYGLGTADFRSSASTEYYKRGNYVPGIWADGMDVIAVRETTRFMIDYAVSGKGPLIVEFETYRYFGHSMSDPGTSYRTRDEVQKVRKTRDPIMLFKNKILSKKLVEKAQLKEIDKKIRKEVDDAAQKARTDPQVGLNELGSDIYVKSVGPHRSVRPDVMLPHLSISKHPLRGK